MEQVSSHLEFVWAHGRRHPILGRFVLILNLIFLGFKVCYNIYQVFPKRWVLLHKRVAFIQAKKAGNTLLPDFCVCVISSAWLAV